MKLVRVMVLGRGWELVCYMPEGYWTKCYRFKWLAWLAWQFCKYNDWLRFNNNAYFIDPITTRKFKWRIKL